MIYSFTVDGNPIPKGRPRFGSGHTFTPKKTKDAEQAIYIAALQARIRPLSANISMSITFYLSPKSHAADIDNLAKTVLDGLNGTAYKDDKQVVRLHLSKQYIDSPRTEIAMEEL